MYKKRIMTWVTLLVMFAVLAGIFYYASYVRKDEKSKRGTFVNAFELKVDEYGV